MSEKPDHSRPPQVTSWGVVTLEITEDMADKTIRKPTEAELKRREELRRKWLGAPPPQAPPPDDDKAT